MARRRVAEASTVKRDPDDEVDLTSSEIQTSRLTAVSLLLIGMLGLVAIWADMLPAAGVLKRFELWQATEVVQTIAADASGVEHVVSEDRVVHVTLADLALAIIIAVVAFVVVRNLPGLLNVSLFRRFPAGERYAYSTLIKYAVAMVGMILAFDAIGVGWSTVQWLVAAVGLGLGFGLQEIFANFISGLIILFERPIRVGDIVTVGNVDGTVTKIRIRATWIVTFDRKELVVPNKEFVTARLINWSLSDAVLRLDVPVGIAYGSDTEKAVEVLKKVARDNRLVLYSPPPEVLFRGFGDSSLAFELRAFIANASSRFRASHEIHMAIDNEFREAGIEIAFPQRDLHIRSVPEGTPVVLDSGQPESPSEG